MKRFQRSWPGGWIIGGASLLLGSVIGVVAFRPATAPSPSGVRQVTPTPTLTQRQPSAGQQTNEPTLPVAISGRYSPGSLNQAWLGSPLERHDGFSRPPDGANCDQLTEWAQLIDRGFSEITLTLKAKRDIAMTVQKIRSKIVSRAQLHDDTPILACVPFDRRNKMPIETWMPAAEQLAWPNYADGFVVDEDGYLATSFRPGYPNERGLLIKLDAGHSEKLDLTGFARSCDCRWMVEVELLVEGRTHTVLVGNEDQPFRTSPPPNRKLTGLRDSVWCLVRGRTQLVKPDAKLCAPPTLQDRPLY